MEPSLPYGSHYPDDAIERPWMPAGYKQYLRSWREAYAARAWREDDARVYRWLCLIVGADFLLVALIPESLTVLMAYWFSYWAGDAR